MNGSPSVKVALFIRNGGSESVQMGSMSGSSAIIRIIQPWHTLVLLLKVLCYISHPGEIKISESQKHFLGRNYEEVKEKLKGLGFTNFVIKEMAMSKIGWGKKKNV